MYQYRYRYYHAQLGRFVGRDPAVDGFNLFEMTGSNPINLIDPSGTTKCAPQLVHSPSQGPLTWNASQFGWWYLAGTLFMADDSSAYGGVYLEGGRNGWLTQTAFGPISEAVEVSVSCDDCCEISIFVDNGNGSSTAGDSKTSLAVGAAVAVSKVGKTTAKAEIELGWGYGSDPITIKAPQLPVGPFKVDLPGWEFIGAKFKKEKQFTATWECKKDGLLLPGDDGVEESPPLIIDGNHSPPTPSFTFPPVEIPTELLRSR